LVSILSQLPETLRSIPETGAAQTENAQAIAEQIKYQNAQQAKLGDILEKVSEAEGDQKDILEALRERVDNLGRSRSHAGRQPQSRSARAMQTVSKHSNTSAQVLEQIARQTSNQREGELQRMLHKQSARYTTMLAICDLPIDCGAGGGVCDWVSVDDQGGDDPAQLLTAGEHSALNPKFSRLACEPCPIGSIAISQILERGGQERRLKRLIERLCASYFTSRAGNTLPVRKETR